MTSEGSKLDLVPTNSRNNHELLLKTYRNISHHADLECDYSPGL